MSWMLKAAGIPAIRSLIDRRQSIHRHRFIQPRSPMGNLIAPEAGLSCAEHLMRVLCSSEDPRCRLSIAVGVVADRHVAMEHVKHVRFMLLPSEGLTLVRIHGD